MNDIRSEKASMCHTRHALFTHFVHFLLFLSHVLSLADRRYGTSRDVFSSRRYEVQDILLDDDNSARPSSSTLGLVRDAVAGLPAQRRSSKQPVLERGPAGALLRMGAGWPRDGWAGAGWEGLQSRLGLGSEILTPAHSAIRSPMDL